MILLALALLGASSGAEEPLYPLGPLRLPPMAEPAHPLRLTDLRFSWEESGSSRPALEARTRLGASVVVGGEAASGRHGLFLDTQRLELGVTESGGQPVIESVFRAPWFLLDLTTERSEAGWGVDGEGSVRLHDDLEVLVGFRDAADTPAGGPPSLEEFIATGELPAPGPPTRELRALSGGLLYQHESDLELLTRFSRTRLRSEAGFDFDHDRLRIASVWNRAPLELETELAHERTHGRLASGATSASVDARLALGGHLVARAGTSQTWESGLLRFRESYRLGGTWFGRRFRFARASAIADEVLALQRRANELGYNERRVYDLEGLRAFRERLGLSPARAELREALDALYRAEVRERNVPQLGFEVSRSEDRESGIESHAYRVFLGVPWPAALPFARDEALVDFVQVELAYREERHPASVRAVSRAVRVVAFLDREKSVSVSWESFGRTPVDIVLERTRPSRLLFGFDYALGR